MSRVPQPNQRRYRGRVRHVMRSAYTHLNLLLKTDTRYRAKPVNMYPNQLAPIAEINTILAAALVISGWLQFKGPIPSR